MGTLVKSSCILDFPHTIAHDFVARLALYMTASTIIFDASFDVLGGQVLTMQSQHHKHPFLS